MDAGCAVSCASPADELVRELGTKWSIPCAAGPQVGDDVKERAGGGGDWMMYTEWDEGKSRAHTFEKCSASAVSGMRHGPFNAQARACSSSPPVAEVRHGPFHAEARTRPSSLHTRVHGPAHGPAWQDILMGTGSKGQPSASNFMIAEPPYPHMSHDHGANISCILQLLGFRSSPPHSISATPERAGGRHACGGD